MAHARLNRVLECGQGEVVAPRLCFCFCFFIFISPRGVAFATEEDDDEEEEEDVEWVFLSVARGALRLLPSR
jgi:hypothetical protein